MASRLGLEPLTPLSFLRRAEQAFADRTAVIDGDRTFTYRQLADRVRRLAGVLHDRGVREGDRVAVIATNSPLMLEAHYAVPSVGAALVALNHRLTTEDMRRIVAHSGATLLLHDDTFADAAEKVADDRLSVSAIEAALADVAPHAGVHDDEERLLSLNYTSGTTGAPKGVMYVHRAAYLQSLAMAYHSGMGPGSVHLWTLPMFHCNGWCFTWAVTAAGATHVCLPKIVSADVWDTIEKRGVTHLNAAPTVLVSLARDPAAYRVGRPLKVATGGSPPSPALLERLSDLNIEVTHLYGLTETYGPSVTCVWQPEWDTLPAERQAALKARQGVPNLLGGRLRVVEDGIDVPSDGATLGEVLISGVNVMRGYWRDDDETRAATIDGIWLRTGDLGVLHPDGYVELRDRTKDIIISGGENIPSVEVEHVLAAHPAVAEAAVVGQPDPRWGEVPVAFVTLAPGAEISAEELVVHARERLARYKVPREFVFQELPKTATGKVQKNLLRDVVAENARGRLA